MRRLAPWPTTRSAHVRLSRPQATAVGAKEPTAKRLYELTFGASSRVSSRRVASWPAMKRSSSGLVVRAEQRRAVLLAQREVDVARVALALVVLRHVGDRHALLGGDLLGAVLVDDVLVGGAQRGAVAEVDLVLAEVALALGVLDLHLRVGHRVADAADERLDAGGPEHRVVDVVAVGRGEVAVAGVPRLLVGVAEDHELELGAGERLPAARGEALELGAQDLARRGDDRAVVGPGDVGQAHRGALLPRHAAQGRDVGPHLEVAVAALPRGHLVAVDGVHVDVDREQVVAGLGAVVDHLLEEVAGRHPLALQAALHVGEDQQHRVGASGRDVGAQLVEGHGARPYRLARARR